MTNWYSWNFLVPKCSFLQCSVWKFSVPEFCFTENTWIHKIIISFFSLFLLRLKGRQTAGVAMCASDAKLERLVANWKLRRCAISHKNEEDFHFIRSFVVVKKKIFRNVTSLFEDILRQIEKKQNWNILHNMFFPYKQRTMLLVYCKIAVPFVS